MVVLPEPDAPINATTCPRGTIGNGLPADYNGFDQSFDTVWNSEGRLTSQGYMLLMTIPFKSLTAVAATGITIITLAVIEVVISQAGSGPPIRWWIPFSE